MRHLDLFTGIGGFAYAAQQVWGNDYEPVAFCDIDKFCQKVLKKHWPDVEIIDDIKDIGQFEDIDLVTAGVPCQPASVAGKKRGSQDKRRQWQVEPDVGRVADGVPNRVDRLKALGNAIVPQVAMVIMEAIKNCNPISRC